MQSAGWCHVEELTHGLGDPAPGRGNRCARRDHCSRKILHKALEESAARADVRVRIPPARGHPQGSAGQGLRRPTRTSGSAEGLVNTDRQYLKRTSSIAVAVLTRNNPQSAVMVSICDLVRWI